MDWTQVITFIIALALGLIILDLTLLGFIPYMIGSFPPFRNLLQEGVLIEDETSDFDRHWRGQRYKALILTRKHLIVRNSYLTSLMNIDIQSISSYSIDKTLASKSRNKLSLNFAFNDINVTFSFTTAKVKDWIKALSELGVEESS